METRWNIMKVSCNVIIVRFIHFYIYAYTVQGIDLDFRSMCLKK